MRLIAVIALGLALALTGAALVASQSADAQSGPRAKTGLLNVAAEYIGIERRALVRELRQGRSLAQSAEAHGKTRAGLKAAILDAIAARVNARTDLTAERKAQILSRAGARVDRLIDRTGQPKRGKHRIGKGLLRVAADYIGVQPRALVRELRGGRSLAESAVAHGKTRAGLREALLGAITARVNSSTNLTAERKAQILARAPAMVDRLIDRKRTR